MFTKTPLGEWVTRWVLDGDLWAGKKGLDFKIASATVSRTSYIYEKLDGTFVTGAHTGTYLPALPILFLIFQYRRLLKITLIFLSLCLPGFIPGSPYTIVILSEA
ncbi:hypothetical protein B7982_14340 [Fibrobacter sp. UWB2]|uniref:hypothetical protein n=1 Tax=Fibrobacter sp. UWB2 TaxID=1964358 RepID=UPI000B52207C|nr:hypothetical protein [Fibrobacter sp. UWB2]OWV19400.1 hypothetical protein B7982_14340 [Fibrobacter sp. UWB2]